MPVLESLPWHGVGLGELRSLVDEAFRLTAWQSRPVDADDRWPSRAEFFEGLAQTFEALLAEHAQRLDAGFLCDGYGDGARAALRAIPVGWRPYDVVIEHRRLLRARAQAERARSGSEVARRSVAPPVASASAASPSVAAGAALPAPDPLSLLFGRGA